MATPNTMAAAATQQPSTTQQATSNQPAQQANTQQQSIANQPVVPAEQKTAPAFEYKPTTSTAENLQQLTREGGAYLTQAQQQGQAQAARRGLGNTTLAGQAAAGEAIRAAAPIAQADAQKEQQKWQLGATVSNNLRGQYTTAQQQLLNQYAISINQIETAQDISTADKNKMIQNTIKRRDADLNFLQNLYKNTPGFNTDWNLFPKAS